MIAGGISTGGVASLEYGNKIFDLISGIFILSLSTVQFPRFVNCNDKESLSACYVESMEFLELFIIPISFILIFFSKEIIILVYARGAFDNSAIEMTSSVLLYYGAGLMAIGIREIVSKILYAKGELKIPVINSIVGVSINIVLNFALSAFLGIGGLALATSITAVLVSVSLLYHVRRYISISVDYKFLMKAILISVISAVASKLLLNMLGSVNGKLAIIITFLGFVAVYALLAFLLKLLDVRKLKSFFKKEGV